MSCLRGQRILMSGYRVSSLTRPMCAVGLAG
eukprot:COSAG01_NODE_31422_length_597_cov_145.365462_1_plen_30_part_10